MIVDYHMHLRAPDDTLDHTVEGVERFVELAAEGGIQEVGFTEHVYYFEPHGKLYPSSDLLREARHRRVGITLASDAHIPQNVGRDLDQAIEHARAAGYDTVTVFDQRQFAQVPLG